MSVAENGDIPQGRVTYFNGKSPKQAGGGNDIDPLERIRDGFWRQQVERYRSKFAELGKTAAAEYKEQLPGFALGRFSHRDDASCIGAPRALCLDYDGVPDAAATRDDVSKSPYCLGAFISPSGNGVKAIFRITPPEGLLGMDKKRQSAWHKLAVDQAIKEAAGYTDAKTDSAAVAYSQLIFGSFDPDCVIRPDAESLPEIAAPEVTPPRASRPAATPHQSADSELTPEVYQRRLVLINALPADGVDGERKSRLHWRWAGLAAGISEADMEAREQTRTDASRGYKPNKIAAALADRFAGRWEYDGGQSLRKAYGAYQKATGSKQRADDDDCVYLVGGKTPRPLAKGKASDALDAIPKPQTGRDWQSLIQRWKRAGRPLDELIAAKGDEGYRADFERAWEDVDAAADGGKSLLNLARQRRQKDKRLDDALDEMDLAANNDANLWVELGDFLGRELLQGKFFYDWGLEAGAGWFWQWRGNHWRLLSKQAPHALLDPLNDNRYRAAARLEDTYPGGAGRKMAELLVGSSYTKQRDTRTSELWTGLRRGLTDAKTPLPAHIIPCPNGLVDLKAEKLQAVEYTPKSEWLATAVTGVDFREVPDAQTIVHAALLPAMPDAEQRGQFVWTLAQAMAGLAGSASYGAFLALIGEGGSGKGWCIRYAQRVFGGLCVGTMPSTLMGKSEVNSGLAEILEADARLVTLGEVADLTGADRVANMLTGDDTVKARHPYHALIERQLRCAMMYSCPQVPMGDMLTGAWRRLMPLNLPGKVLDRVGREGCVDYPTQEQVEALGYLLLLRAAELHAGKKPDALYVEPAATVEHAVEADVLLDWLRHLPPEENQGITTRDAYEKFRLERPEGRLKYGGQSKFTRAINTNEVRRSTGWYIVRDRGSGTPHAGNKENRLFTSRLYNDRMEAE